MAEAARSDDDRDRSRHKGGQTRLDGVVGREARVGQGHVLDRVEIPQRHEVAFVVDEHELSHRARCAETGWDDVALGCHVAVVLVALGARRADSAPPRPVDGDRLAHRHGGHPGSDLGDDAGAFVTEGEGQPVDVGLLRQAHDELVGVARARGGHLEQHLPRARCGLLDLHHAWRLADLDVLQCLHGATLCERR